MNGADIKKAAISKAKQVATAANNAANGNGTKKRRKGGDLKPIITTEDQQAANSSPKSANTMNSARLVSLAVTSLMQWHAAKLRLTEHKVQAPQCSTQIHN